MTVKPGGIRIGLEYVQDLIVDLPNINANVATDGVQYSSIATFGTTAAEIYNQLVDNGFNLTLKNLKVGLTQMFTGLNGSFVGSINYYWEARSEGVRIGSGGTPVALTGAWVNITGTYIKSVPTLLTSEDTFSGEVNLGSLPIAPVRLRLVAINPDRAVGVQGKVKSSSYIQMVGLVIPGV